MNHKVLTSIPYRQIIINIILLVTLAAIFVINIFICLQVKNDEHARLIILFLLTVNALIIIAIVGYLIMFYFQVKQFLLAEANHNSARRIEQEKSAHELNEKLTLEMQELGIYTEKMSTLVELSELVQACVNFKEATKAIVVKCRKILHFVEGTLYIMNSNTNLLEFATSWGDPSPHEKTISPDQCWALRKGGVYQVKNPQTDLICDHIKESSAVPYLCIPLTAQNAIFGLLHLDFPVENPPLSNENRLLISAVSETLSLALANIKLRETLRNQSLHDSLTGLYNRRFLEEFLIKEVDFAERNQLQFALLMIDVDYFKQFNDRYGHVAGDLILQELGQFFQQDIRMSDMVCRYGGEEFLCVLHDCNLADAIKRAENLRTKISNISIEFNNQKLDHLTVSIGIAMYPDDSKVIPELIEAADQALYYAKNTKRDKTISYAEMKHKSK